MSYLWCDLKTGKKKEIDNSQLVLIHTIRSTELANLIISDIDKFIEEQKMPSQFDVAFKEHQEEMRRLEEQRKKRFEEARAEKIHNGEQVDFGVSIRTIEGNLIPVDNS